MYRVLVKVEALHYLILKGMIEGIAIIARGHFLRYLMWCKAETKVNIWHKLWIYCIDLYSLVL